MTYLNRRFLALQDATGKVVGATCVDNETGQKFDVKAKCVVNAAGPFCDDVRKMGQKEAKPMITPSSGVHLTLPSYFRHAVVTRTRMRLFCFLPLVWLSWSLRGGSSPSKRFS